MATPQLLPQPDLLVDTALLRRWIPTKVGTIPDAVLDLLTAGASNRLIQAMNRTHFLLSNPFNPLVEWYSGNGTPWLQLRQYPVRSVTSVLISQLAFFGQGQTPSQMQALVAGTDYFLVADAPDGVSSLSGILTSINSFWQETYVNQTGMLSSYGVGGQGNIQVTYSVGYDVVPPELKMACLQLCSLALQTRKRGRPVSSESYEEYSYSISGAIDKAWGLLEGELNNVISRYRIVAAGPN